MKELIELPHPPSIWAYEDYNEYLDAYGAWKDECKKMISEQNPPTERSNDAP
jgi:hypothetical protein